MNMVEQMALAIGKAIIAKAKEPEGRSDIITADDCRDIALAALRAMQNPTQGMVEAGANTPGMKAVSDLAIMSQARGYDFPEDALAGGSPLEQAWSAMVATAIEEGEGDV